MKNKIATLTLLIMITLVMASCAGSRTGYGNHRKGYGCPATSCLPNPSVEENKI